MVQDEKMYLVISHLIQYLKEFGLFPVVVQANSLTHVVHFKETPISLFILIIAYHVVYHSDDILAGF